MSLIYMAPAYQIGLNVTPMENAPEAATQTFKKGAILVPSSGNLAEGGANPTTIVGVSVLAGQNGSAGVPITQYCPALPHQVFVATLDDAGASPYTFAAGDRWTKMGVTKDGTTGFWFVDHAKNGANQRVQIIGAKDAIGVSQARVYIIFLETQTIYT